MPLTKTYLKVYIYLHGHQITKVSRPPILLLPNLMSYYMKTPPPHILDNVATKVISVARRLTQCDHV